MNIDRGLGNASTQVLVQNLIPSAIHSSSPHNVLLMHSDCDFRKLRLRDDDG